MYFAFWILLLVLHWASVWLAMLNMVSVKKKLYPDRPPTTTTRGAFWMAGTTTLILAVFELVVAKIGGALLALVIPSIAKLGLIEIASFTASLVEGAILFFMIQLQAEGRKRLAAYAQANGGSPA